MNVMTMPRDMVGVLEAWRMSGIHGSELYRMIFRGELEAVPTLEHGVLVPVDAVRRLMAERAGTAQQD